MALLMFVVYIFTWVLRGGSAIDAVRLCSMYLYGMPPPSCCVYPLDCVGPVCMCFQCLYVMLLCLFVHFLPCCVNRGAIAFSGVT